MPLRWLLLAVVLASAAFARPQLPIETISAGGLVAPVEILIDSWGVPHIYASSERDLFFAQGFNAARDRLFQIDLWRRRGLGQLSEAFGPAFVEQDNAARLFLYRGDMATEWARYGKDAQATSSRFVAGVNAYIDWLEVNPDRVPYEYRRLGYKPSKWAAADVVRIRSKALAYNLRSEVARAQVMCKADLRSDAIRRGLQPPWLPQVPDDLDPCLPKDVLKVFDLATRDVRLPKPSTASTAAEPVWLASLENEEPSEGSNNWVIAPSKSATGRAILANDPHRAYAVPSLRYLVHLSAPGLDVIGAGEPSLPGISLGHNGTIAFGLTIFSIDQEDLYVYETNPANVDEYRYQGRWESMRVVRETISVKGAPPVTVDLRFTRHGPVIYSTKEKNRAIAVRSVWLEPGTAPYARSLDAMRARNFQQFSESMRFWGTPPLNLVYADVKGNIGWVPAGMAPIRSNWDGLLPVPGDGRYEWTGFWPQEKLPSSYKPTEGWFGTANQMNLPADFPWGERKIGFEWINGSRYARIAEVLRTLPKVYIENSTDLQNDILSIPSRRLAALVRPLSSPDARTQAALELIRGWDYVEHSESAQAALVEVWMSRHLGKAFKEAVLTKEAAAAMGAPDPAVMLDALEKPWAYFGENAVARRNDILLMSLGQAWAEMEKLQGADPRAWQWGKLHHVFIEHPFTDVVDEAERQTLNVGPLPKHGGAFTVNQSNFKESDFRLTVGPSVRMVVDVGHWDESRVVNCPGQSGDPASPHYRDLMPMWRTGKYFPLLYSRKAVENNAEKRIRLVPVGLREAASRRSSRPKKE